MMLAELKRGDMAEILGYLTGMRIIAQSCWPLASRAGFRSRWWAWHRWAIPLRSPSGYHLSLRRDEVGGIKVKKLVKGEAK